MNTRLQIIQWGCVGLLGATLCYGATWLSLCYNSLTARFRERNPYINPPPTPEARNSNTKRMTWLFRILGAFLFLSAIMALLGIRHPR
jgi:hypothetical protein